MRLQGAIFDYHGTILDDKGNSLPGVDRVLSMMKMEDVWMYLVCDGDPVPVRSALEGAGLWGRFRGLISAAEHGGDPLDPELYEIMAAPQEVLDRCEAYLVLPQEIRTLYNDLWIELGT